MTEWKPIETAPEDAGRDVRTELPFSANKGPAIAYDDDTGEALYMVWFSEISRGVSQTTHWATLPPPPEDKQ